MCKGSTLFRDKVEAVAGQRLMISNGGDVGKTVAMLHEPDKGFNGKALIKCAVCIDEPSIVTLRDIPAPVRAKYGYAYALTAIFVPGGDDTDDVIRTVEGIEIPFNDFIGPNVQLEVVQIGLVTEPVEVVLAAA